MSKKEFQDIFTPDHITKEILKFIPIKDGDKVLEPTAGNMCEVLLKQCKDISIELTCNEIQKKHYGILKTRLTKYGKIKADKKPFNAFEHFFKNP